MLYRPNFCCNCGEKIERAEWKLSSSRKFCDLCQTEFRYKDIGVKAGGMIGLLISLAIISSIFRQPDNSDSSLTKSLTARSLAEKIAPESNLNTTPVGAKQSQPVANSNSPAANAPVVSDQKVSVKTTDPVYYCGAATKKGTPCSRRVKRPGERCWQHTGMPAMTETATASQK